MAYEFLMNAECPREFLRYKWVSLGRTQASQSSNGIDELGRMITWGQNGYGRSGQGDSEISIPCATQLGSATNWIKACSGEISTIALNLDNELWGWGFSEEHCEPFGLPPGSGDDGGSIFYTPTRVAPGYDFKDVAHDYYHTLAIGLDNKLWTWGMNYDYALGAGFVDDLGVMTPTLNPTLTDDIKLIDCEYLANVAVTTNDKVYVWGYFWLYSSFDYQIPTEVTGLVIPAGETIVNCNICGYGVLILLSNGELWVAGHKELFGDQGVAYPTGTAIFKQVTELAARNIVKLKATALGSISVFVIDSDGNIWGFSDDPDWYTGNATPPVWNTWNSIGDTNVTYIDVINNTHQRVYQAIDDQGYLWTWGYQGWGPHLAICKYRDEVLLREIAGLAAPAIDALGEPILLNNLEGLIEGLSDYVQPLPQILHHKPCGHWHLRLFEGEPPTYPINCWMCSLAISGNILLFVAAGKHLHNYPETGNEVLMFTYNMDANIWTNILWDNFKNAAEYPGGTDIDTDIYAFANYKLDVSGTKFNEVYTNPAMGIWVVHPGGSEYVEFVDSIEKSAKNKLGVHSSGLVALVYTNSAGQLIVKISTDFGVTYVTRRTIGALINRNDYSLAVDNDGYIYLAHQISTSSVKVEKSIDNGLNWTNQIASKFILTNLEEIKLVADNSMLFLLCASDTVGAIERSSNGGTSWTTVPDEPSNSIVASGCNVDDSHNNIAFVMADDTMYNYIYDGGYDWFERDITQLNIEGTTINVIATKKLADLAGNNGRFAYASYGFYTVPEPYIAVSISNDMGQHWDVRATPLAYGGTSLDELTDFQGCPLFCITDVPYLNHVWKFEKSTDSKNWVNDCGFVKQKDKYEKVIKCECPCKITKTV